MDIIRFFKGTVLHPVCSAERAPSTSSLSIKQFSAPDVRRNPYKFSYRLPVYCAPFRFPHLMKNFSQNFFLLFHISAIRFEMPPFCHYRPSLLQHAEKYLYLARKFPKKSQCCNDCFNSGRFIDYFLEPFYNRAYLLVLSKILTLCCLVFS